MFLTPAFLLVLVTKDFLGVSVTSVAVGLGGGWLGLGNTIPSNHVLPAIYKLQLLR